MLLIGVWLTSLIVVRFVLPRTEVTTDGIDRGWRRPRKVAWRDVESVASQQQWTSYVRLNLTDGRTVSLPDIRADQTTAVAALGDRPIRDVPYPAPHSRPSPVQPRPPADPPRRTDQQITDDVTRRAQALAAERAQLEAGNRGPRQRDQRAPGDPSQHHSENPP